MLNFLASLFYVKNPQREAKNQLREAQLALLEAGAAKEHWDARLSSLKLREKRLQTQVDADERAAAEAQGRNSYTIS